MNNLILERLERTFREDQASEERERAIRAATEAEIRQQFGGDLGFLAARIWAHCMTAIEQARGTSWREDLVTNRAVREFSDTFLRAKGPPGALHDPIDGLAQMEAQKFWQRHFGLVTPERQAAEEKWLADQGAAAGTVTSNDAVKTKPTSKPKE